MLNLFERNILQSHCPAMKQCMMSLGTEKLFSGPIRFICCVDRLLFPSEQHPGGKQMSAEKLFNSPRRLFSGAGRPLFPSAQQPGEKFMSASIWTRSVYTCVLIVCEKGK